MSGGMKLPKNFKWQSLTRSKPETSGSTKSSTTRKGRGSTAMSALRSICLPVVRVFSPTSTSVNVTLTTCQKHSFKVCPTCAASILKQVWETPENTSIRVKIARWVLGC
uniref:SsDNA binding protein n=1 Tax=uncultured marine virus TaxID=186617 RepID=A0A0F7L8H0_9VIRU|nr:ssDNA binding protein [uncultured marine virus]